MGHAQAANVFTQARANIHARVKTAMSSIDLQTMSYILVDLPGYSSTRLACD
jgi:hypothetical protein